MTERKMNFTIYTKDGCSYCSKIKQVLMALGENFVEYRLNQDFDREQFVSEFGHGSTFPRVLMNGQLLGGCNETIVYLRNQGLV